jgi:cyclopropane-fatty-acyl-phospholipid synthase
MTLLNPRNSASHSLHSAHSVNPLSAHLAASASSTLPTLTLVQLQAIVSRKVAFLLRLAHRLPHGYLRIITPDQQQLHCGESQTKATLHAEIHIHDWHALERPLKNGDIGFAEGYIAGEWDTPNLTQLLSLLTANRHALESLVYGTWWGNLIYRIKHFLHRNTKAQARKNIHAHYDISNDFYRLWLDASMTYSSALFTHPEQSLQLAQTHKYQRALDELHLTPDTSQRILEIGCGWGGFAEHVLTTRLTTQLTGVSLSVEQLNYANQRLATQNLSARADLRLQDYRDIAAQETQPFDGIVSIEMFEAVGEAYWQDYFECIAHNLKPNGRAVIQTITIANELFERYRQGTDFIQQYIFPGGMLPCPRVFEQLATQAGLQIVNRYAFGYDYAKTLNAWQTTFNQQQDALIHLGFDAKFMRTWRFYFAYCEAGFMHHNIDVYQYTLTKAN